MSERWTIERVLELVEGDHEFVEQLYVYGICERRSDGFSPDEAETARLAHVLVRDLEVNWPGVEIILRLRGEILDTHRQVADLLDLMRQTKVGRTSDTND